MKIKISLHKIWRIPVFLFSWRSSQGMRCENSPEYGEVIRLKKSIQTKKCEMWNQIMSQKIPIFHFTFRLGRCARCDVFPSERLARLQLVTWQELLSDSLLGGLSSSPAPCLSLSLLSCPLSVVRRVEGHVPQGNPYLKQQQSWLNFLNLRKLYGIWGSEWVFLPSF